MPRIKSWFRRGHGDGLHGVLSAGVHLSGDGELVGAECWWSATDSSSGGGEAGHGAVADEVAFEFGEGAEEVEHEFSAGGPDLAFGE